MLLVSLKLAMVAYSIMTYAVDVDGGQTTRLPTTNNHGINNLGANKENNGEIWNGLLHNYVQGTHSFVEFLKAIVQRRHNPTTATHPAQKKDQQSQKQNTMTGKMHHILSWSSILRTGIPPSSKHTADNLSTPISRNVQNKDDKLDAMDNIEIDLNDALDIMEGGNATGMMMQYRSKRLPPLIAEGAFKDREQLMRTLLKTNQQVAASGSVIKNKYDKSKHLQTGPLKLSQGVKATSANHSKGYTGNENKDWENSKEYKEQLRMERLPLCIQVCQMCQKMLSLRWGAMCSHQCQNKIRGIELSACVIVWKNNAHYMKRMS